MNRHGIQDENIICTECGWPRVIRERPWWSRPLTLAILLALAFVVTAAARVRGVTASSGSEPPRFVTPVLSAARARALLADTTPEGDQHLLEVVRAILRSADLNPRIRTVGPALIHAAFGPAEAPVEDRWLAGWPATWVRGESAHVYDDAVLRAGFRPARTDATMRMAGKWEGTSNPLRTPPRRLIEMWGLDVVISPAPEQTSGVLRRWFVHLPGVAITATLLACAWALAGWAARRKWSGQENRRRVRRAQVVTTVVCATLCAVFAVMTFTARTDFGNPRWVRGAQQGLPPAPVYWLNEPCADIGLTNADIARMARDPADARQVLERIVATAPVVGDPARAILALALYPTAWVQPLVATPNMWYPDLPIPLGSVSMLEFTRHPLAGEPVRIETTPKTIVRLSDGHLNIRQDRGTRPSLGVWVNLESFAVVALTIWGLAVVYRAALAVRPASRRRRGLCPRCAYPLQAERAAGAADGRSGRGSAGEGTRVADAIR